LEIKSHSFCDAEIFCVLGDVDLHFFACPEKMIDRIATCENNSAEILDLNFLLSEFFAWDWFEANERVKLQFHIEFFRQFKIRRLIRFRSRLGN
jgi:hypothetical protein